MVGKLTHVSVKMGAGHNLMTVEEFAAIPVGERIEMVLAQRVTFLDELGAVIPVLDAVDQIPAVRPKKK